MHTFFYPHQQLDMSRQTVVMPQPPIGIRTMERCFFYYHTNTLTNVGTASNSSALLPWHGHTQAHLCLLSNMLKPPPEGVEGNWALGLHQQQAPELMAKPTTCGACGAQHKWPVMLSPNIQPLLLFPMITMASPSSLWVAKHMQVREQIDFMWAWCFMRRGLCLLAYVCVCIYVYACVCVCARLLWCSTGVRGFWVPTVYSTLICSSVSPSPQTFTSSLQSRAEFVCLHKHRRDKGG